MPFKANKYRKFWGGGQVPPLPPEYVCTYNTKETTYRSQEQLCMIVHIIFNIKYILNLPIYHFTVSKKTILCILFQPEMFVYPFLSCALYRYTSISSSA